MKVRDSGMPKKEYWDSFFDTQKLIDIFFNKKIIDEDIVEFGSGYGTFTFPASSYSRKFVYALDIEDELIQELKKEAKERNIENIICKKIDFLEDGTMLEENSCGHTMIYNLLHLENPNRLLDEAYRVLKKGGTISIIHWRSDIKTPRGPILEIRPKIEDCINWLEKSKFLNIEEVNITDIAPYHYGIIAKK